ncbi:DUF5807 family protein [Halorussus gelatinilyticus]|uniref:DUF5807 family protein n=1 Tax=Halorussus gelatinilyticus TaxID=2937524 RepID=A0A8U0INI0_9EURY|nr:DUF5807 family protein [Halorussus gelatinilyticus]UPW02151.1 DUF5807 family protein [Halorussus gelatinilyticus]
MSKREQFLSGERPEDVALFLSDSFVEGDGDGLAKHGESVENGVVLVVEGDQGRSVFKTATGMDAMGFAKQAMGTEGAIARDLSGGDCPECDGDAEFVFAFAEEQNEEVGDLYAEGDVIHAYSYCDCGTAYSDKWVAGEAE